MQHTPKDHCRLWNNIKDRLDSRRPKWRTYVDETGQLAAVGCRSAGRSWTDDEVFKALLIAVLSSDTDWWRIKRIQGDLAELFYGFSLKAYASVSDSEITNRLVPWFKERKAGSRSLKRNLGNLVGAAGKLLDYTSTHGAADNYFTSLMTRCNQDPKQAALCLGVAGEYKLPSLGLSLAAQTLKNLGFDLVKPDRHIMRAVEAFGLVDFSPRKCVKTAKDERKAPNQTPQRQWLAMNALEEMAADTKQHAVLVDNAIWLLCERGGKPNQLYLTNAELAKLAP